MTDREKFRTLGSYYMFIARNYEKAIENYETLVSPYPADDAGHGNLSIAYLFTGNLRGAIEQVRKVLDLNPRSNSDRYNYAIYSLYAEDFDTAVREGTRLAKEAPDFPPGGLLPVALATLLRGDYDGARAAYAQLEKVSASGQSLGRFGRADIQMYLGMVPRRARHAARRDRRRWERRRQRQARTRPGRRGGELPRPRASREAVAAARKAVALSPDNESVLVPAALALISAGRPEEAEKVAVTLENMLQTHMTAYARLISAECRGGTRAATRQPSSCSATASRSGTPGSRASCSDALRRDRALP